MRAGTGTAPAGDAGANAAAITAAVVGAGIAVGTVVGKLPPSLPAIRAEAGLSLYAGGWLVALVQCAGAVFALAGGALADRFGPRRTMRTGLALLVLGALAGILAGRPETLFAARMVESAGVLLTVLPGPALLLRHVPPARIRTVLTVWGTYMPIGMSLALVLAPWLIAGSGWRAAWAASGGLCLLAGFAVARVVPADPPVTAGGLPREPFAGLLRTTLRAGPPWLLAATFGTYAAAWVGVFAFLPTFWREAGLSLAQAGLLTALGVSVNVAGNLGAGVLLQRGIRRGPLIAAAATGMAVSAAGVFADGTPLAVRVTALVLFSMIGGLIPSTLFAATAACAPSRATLGTTTGLMVQGASLGQVLAPPLFAAVVTATGGWQGSAWVAAALSAGCIAAAVGMIRADRAATEVDRGSVTTNR